MQTKDYNRDEEKSGPVLTWTHYMSVERRKSIGLGEETRIMSSFDIVVMVLAGVVSAATVVLFLCHVKPPVGTINKMNNSKIFLTILCYLNVL